MRQLALLPLLLPSMASLATEPEETAPPMALLEYIGNLEQDESGRLLDPMDTVPDTEPSTSQPPSLTPGTTYGAEDETR